MRKRKTKAATVAQCASAWGVSHQLVYQWIKNKRLKAGKIGAIWLVYPDASGKIRRPKRKMRGPARA